MDYGYVIKKAVRITRKNKFLWLYGFILVLFNEGIVNISNIRIDYPVSEWISTYPSEWKNLLPQPVGSVPVGFYMILVMGFMILYITVGIIFSAFSRGVLIKSADRFENGEKINFQKSWVDGKSKMGPLSLLHALLISPYIIFTVIIILLILTVFWPSITRLIISSTSLTNQNMPTTGDPFLSIFYFLSMLMTCSLGFWEIFRVFFITFGSRAIVLENYSIFESFTRSKSIFKKNIGKVVIPAIIIFLAALFVGLIIGIIGITLIFSVLYLASLKSGQASAGFSDPSLLIMGGFLVLGFLFINLLVGGIFKVFLESFWTFIYRKLTIQDHPQNETMMAGEPSTNPT